MWLPVAQRELIVASRKGALYWIRLIAPALGLLLLLVGSADLPTKAPQQQGKAIFLFVAWALFLYSVFAGLFFTAECISSERREATLPLLQLTGIRELDLVLGKMLANALPGIFGFIAATPLLAVPFLAGGVPASDFARVFAVLLGTLFLSLAIGIFSSSHTGSTRSALKETFRTLAYVVCLGIIGLFYRRIRNPQHWAKNYQRVETRWFFVLNVILVWYFRVPTGSPVTLMFESFGWRSPFPSREAYAIGLLLLGAMGAYFLFGARPFSIAAEEEESVLEEPKQSEPLHRRPPLMRGTNPIRWILAPTDAELLLTGGWAMIGGLIGFLSGSFLYARNSDLAATVLMWGAFAVTCFIYFLFARRAAEFIVNGRRTGMLEVILLTPLPWSELLLQHRQTFIRFAWFPSAILLAGELMGQVAAQQFIPTVPSEFYVVLPIASIASYICTLFATLWCAIFFALHTRSSTHAALYTVILVLVLPATIGFLIPAAFVNVFPIGVYSVLSTDWVFVFFAGGLWAASRIRLNSLDSTSPAFICDRRLQQN